jgi:2-methylisocitrate lyase-like PEP mutase family enzyme
VSQTTIELPLGLRPKAGRSRRFVEMLASGQTIVAPGAFDCISARLVETAGFPAVYITGSGVSMSILGAPDVGVVSFKEVVEHIGRIADVVSIPVIADADTGYGGAVNIFRTVREFERAGVSAIQIEDQQWPKRCGHEPGRRLVSPAVMEGRLRAALAARQDPDFKIIARTDARATEGIDAAIDRIKRYRDTGVDILFVESPESKAELERIVREAPGVHLANMVEGGRTPVLSVDSLRRLGFRIVIFPNSLTRLFARMGGELLVELGRTGTTAGYRDRMLDHRQLWDLFDNSGWVALADRFESPAPNA